MEGEEISVDHITRIARVLIDNCQFPWSAPVRAFEIPHNRLYDSCREGIEKIDMCEPVKVSNRSGIGAVEAYPRGVGASQVALSDRDQVRRKLDPENFFKRKSSHCHTDPPLPDPKSTIRLPAGIEI
jgi:hypothetical protein